MPASKHNKRNHLKFNMFKSYKEQEVQIHARETFIGVQSQKVEIIKDRTIKCHACLQQEKHI